MPRSRTLRVVLGLIATVVAITSVAVAAGVGSGGGQGRIGPRLHLTGNGRLLQPPGQLVTLGHFPTGGAMTPDGRFYWTVSTGRALNDIRIVAVSGKHPRVIQVLGLPGASGGIAIDGRHARAYVSGLPDSSDTDQMRPHLPGRGGDVIHVFRYDRHSGRAHETGTIAVPPPASATAPQNFPPKPSVREAWPDRLAVSPDGGTLLVPLNLADSAAIIDTRSHAVRYVPTGTYPYAAAILPGGRTGLVSNEGPGTVSVISLASATKVKDIQAGANLSHPEGIALNPKTSRAYVAIANESQVAVIDTKRLRLEKVLSVDRALGGGESPVAVAVSRNGRRLFAAESAADELAVFALPSGQRIGRIPTAAYPADVQTTRRSLLWIAAKGFGAGPNRNGPDPLSSNDNNLLAHPGSAVLSSGRAGILPLPTDLQLRAFTLGANRQIIPTNFQPRPPGNPLRSGGPIKHVFFIIRENRTYDQVLGDDPRGDGAPSLTLFGKHVTPNIHALVRRFPLLDHVYANSEASIDGHFWTSAAAVSDYVQRNWEQNYAGRNRPYDFGAYTISWPGTGFLFDRAQRQQIPYFNYGEVIAGTIPPNILKVINVVDKNITAKEAKLETQKFSHSNVGYPFGCYPNDTSIGTDSIYAALNKGAKAETFDSSLPPGVASNAESRFDCFKTAFEKQIATGKIPAFNYLILPSDHTNGVTPGARTPRSMVAENDYGLGQIVDLISHSKIWRSSAIFTIEDDSQDGADHVDAHRMPVGIFSPFAKRGAVIHTRYDMLSVIRSIELILGMKPLGLADRVATPMYDVFTPRPANAAPFSVRPPTYPIAQRNANTAVNRALTRGYDFTHIDRVPQDVFDQVLWHAIHGKSAPPPPGPNATPGQ
ncbi:MAG: bifunctional YncE family protein/alkaline phosphatase family protein [Solirubrobacteraceae bacterium]